MAPSQLYFCGMRNSPNAHGISAMLDWKINAVLHCIEGHVWRFDIKQSQACVSKSDVNLEVSVLQVLNQKSCKELIFSETAKDLS